MQFKSHSRQNAAAFVMSIALWMTVDGMAQAALTLTGPLNLSHSGNLVQNGSFEDHPDGGVTIHYWAAGTASTPFAQPANWVTNGASLNYAHWGNTAVFATSSAPLPDGTSGLYFGNGLMAAISETPTFNADGSVTFISPTPTIVPKYSPPVTLSQTLTGLNTGTTYGLTFWTSGEDAATTGFTHDGFFGLDVTGYSTVYLAAPSGLSTLGQSHVYNFTFTPVSSNTTITFTNWGHPNGSMPGWTLPGIATELVLDDVIVNVIPEPSALALLSVALACACAAFPPRKFRSSLLIFPCGSSIQTNTITLQLAFPAGRLRRAPERILQTQTDHVAHASLSCYGSLIPGDDFDHAVSLAVGPAFAGAV